MALPASPSDPSPSGGRPDYQDVERWILELISSEPDQVWRATDVVAGIPSVDLFDVLPALARLTYHGHLARVAAGRYRWPGVR